MPIPRRDRWSIRVIRRTLRCNSGSLLDLREAGALSLAVGIPAVGWLDRRLEPPLGELLERTGRGAVER